MIERSVKTYRINGLFEELGLLSSDRDIVIIVRDPFVPAKHSLIIEKLVSANIPTACLEFSDIDSRHVGRFRCWINRKLSVDDAGIVKFFKLKKVWPTKMFTRREADDLLDFVVNNASADRDIHIACDYARSRSVAIAIFLQRYLFPRYELALSRECSRPNSHVYKTLSESWGV